mgnify:CR=1 FL=1
MHDQKPLLGLIFNIQKFSVNDGPGIRTTVFIKGCPLRCRWCANPESQLPRIQILQDRQKCLNCHHCLEICPEQAISLAATQLKWNPLTCTGCLQCVSECPQQALSHTGEWKSVEEVLHLCLQDRDFYEESRGGVTLSGGEVLSSPDFAIALLTELQQEGVDLVGGGRTLPHEPFTHPMQGRERLLGFIARRHEAHAGPTGCFADRLRVVEVVPVVAGRGLAGHGDYS